MTGFEATVVPGLGEAEGFITLPWVTDQLVEKLSCSPYPGTLNLHLSSDAMRIWVETRQNQPGVRLAPPPRGFAIHAVIR